jgi:hypothetical protein
MLTKIFLGNGISRAVLQTEKQQGVAGVQIKNKNRNCRRRITAENKNKKCGAYGKVWTRGFLAIEKTRWQFRIFDKNYESSDDRNSASYTGCVARCDRI